MAAQLKTRLLSCSAEDMADNDFFSWMPAHLGPLVQTNPAEKEYMMLATESYKGVTRKALSNI